jgi:hypothetical protein
LQVRVELHLRTRGLFVQLLAVVHDVCDPYTADVRFVSLSRRKQEELAEMLAELLERREDAA